MSRDDYESFFETVNAQYENDVITLTDLDTGDTMSVVIDENNRATAVDMVNSPKHYILRDGLEVKDVRIALLQKLMTDGIVMPYEDAHEWMTAWEYVTRAPFKNGREDLEKAKWYLDSIIDRMIARGEFRFDSQDD